MDLNEYQSHAFRTVRVDAEQNAGKVELVLGLTSEVGSLAAAYKRLLRDDLSLDILRQRLAEDLGDVLWYLAAVASSLGLKLKDVAAANLDRTDNRYRATDADPAFILDFDARYPEHERFPRQMLFEMFGFDGTGEDPRPMSSFKVIDARPNPFQDGPRGGPNGQIGFALNSEIGDAVDDNARMNDGYRFHDAVHVAFMAVLGWSPVMRTLLRVKRKSVPATDRIEDGARAGDLEEALSAILMEFSRDKNGFRTDADVDGETRDLARRAVQHLEVHTAPLWLWARAIRQGFSVMHALRENNGGWVLADLDARKIEFFAERPEF